MIINFKYTETFLSIIKDQGLDKKLVNTILDRFERHLNSFPECCGVHVYLQEIGVTKYRGYISPENCTLLYSYENKGNVVTVHAILHQRQDIQKLLFNRIIER